MSAKARPRGDAAWYRRTQHCGQCGQPDGYCLCRDSAPCGCRELHRMGSGLLPDAVEAFAEPAPVISADQGDLFSDGAA